MRAIAVTMLILATATACKSTDGTTAAPAPGITTAAARTTAGVPTTEAVPTSTAAPAGATPDPCTLVTPPDVTAALGTPAGTPRSLAVGLYRQCVYPGGLVVEVRNIDRATFDKSAPLNPGNPQPLSGVGDAAYSSSQGILAWKNGTEVVIAGGSAAADKQLALTAVSRLP